jgi:uncharacterized protein GlcG (DUF336 family)
MALKIASFLLLACLALSASPASADRSRGRNRGDDTSKPPFTAPSIVLTIAGAEAAIAAAVQRGAELNFTALNIVVVDRNGDVKASRRGDGASVASYILTKEKAYTAANFGITSSTVAQRFGGANSTAFTPLVVNQAGLLQVPQITLVGGGAPISINGATIGAIGVGGTPSGATDEEIATAGASVIV